MASLSEKTKAEKGLWYDAAHDAVLQQEMVQAHTLCHELNALRPDEAEARRSLLRRLLGSTPERFDIVSPFFCDYGYHIRVGEDFFANAYLTVLDAADVSIGNRVFIGPNCGLYTAVHPLDPKHRATGEERALPITICDDVWLGGGVTVLAGIIIGEGSVVGAGSVVTHDVPPHCVVVGNPARVIRRLSVSKE